MERDKGLGVSVGKIVSIGSLVVCVVLGCLICVQNEQVEVLTEANVQLKESSASLAKSNEELSAELAALNDDVVALEERLAAETDLHDMWLNKHSSLRANIASLLEEASAAIAYGNKQDLINVLYQIDVLTTSNVINESRYDALRHKKFEDIRNEKEREFLESLIGDSLF